MGFGHGNNPIKIRRSNQASILRMIYQFGPITRSEIAEQLGLTMPTITRNVNTMIERGLVHEVGSPDNAAKYLGRKPRLIDIVPDSRYFLGAEMQKNQRRLCVADYSGKIVKKLADYTTHNDYESNIRCLCKMISRLTEECRDESISISGIGIAVPGLVNREEGILNIHPGYNWQDKAISIDISELTGYTGPVYLENNACARAFSAQLFNKELLDSEETIAYLFVSTGIACPMINGFSASNALMGEGEIGHMVMNPKGPRCRCGNRGCLEAYSSDRSVISQCEKAAKTGKAPALASLCKEHMQPDLSLILKAQEQRDEEICRIIHNAVTTLGIGIANIDNFARPHTVLIEGQLFTREENRSLLLKTINENLYTSLGKYAISRFLFVEPAEYGGALGGAAVAIRKNLDNYI